MSQSIPELEARLAGVTDQRSRIDLCNELAWAKRFYDPEQSRQLSEQARELATSGEFAIEAYLPGVAASLRNLAYLNNDAGNYDLALELSLQAFEILEDASEGKRASGRETSLLMIDVLGNIGWTYRGFGDYGVAAEYGMKALKLAQGIGERTAREARLLGILSNIYAESNDLDAALDMGQGALQCYRELGLKDGESLALNNLAMTFLQMGNGAKALEACNESLRIAHENGISGMARTALSTLGEVYLGIEDYAQAEVHLQQALALARESQASYDEFLGLLNLGKVHYRQQDDQAALAALQGALAIAQESNDRPGQFQCHQLLSEVYEKQGDLEAALRHFKQFHALKETVFNENAARRLAGLKVIHQVETAKRDAEIQHLKTIELQKEIEERKAVQAALEELATIDPLTRLLNRREFFALGELAVQRARRDGQPLAAILLDLDRFKRINDTYGHTTGDQVLALTAKTVRESLRQGEIVGRYGGDEFVILLPGSNRAQGQQVAERLHENVTSQTIATGQGDLRLAISLGVAEFQVEKCASLEALLDHADRALYAAKRAGRDRLGVYREAL